MRPVTIFGVEYPSIKELQKAYPYLSVGTLAKRIRAGMTDAEIVTPPAKGPMSLVIENDYYESVSAAAKETSVPYPTYLYRVRKMVETGAGGTIVFRKDYSQCPTNDGSDSPLRKAIVIEGVCYPSYKAASIALGINYQTLISRIKNGWYAHDNGKMISPPKKKTRGPGWGNVITYEGVTYRSHRELARAYGVDPGRFARRLAAGCSMEVALEQDFVIEYKGVIYANKSELALAYGADVRRFLYRINLGYSIDDALSTKSNAELRAKYKALRENKSDAPVEPTIPPQKRISQPKPKPQPQPKPQPKHQSKPKQKREPCPEVWSIFDDLEDIEF